MTSPMIAVISSSQREASALAALTSAASKATSTCGSLGHFKTLLRKVSPAVVLTRHNLVDGYSDDVISALAKSNLLPGTAVIVLTDADCTSRQEARQLDLGADCVLKDPLRPDVLLEYTAKFLRTRRGRPGGARPQDQFAFAGAIILPDQRQLKLGKKTVHLSPKEVELARLLAHGDGRTVTYEALYSELFGRNFCGDSANGRVLLGKLTSSFQKLRINLRALVQVVPKLGYRYSPAAVKGPA
jgi:DNA-binding response OmpR family regulator